MKSKLFVTREMKVIRWELLVPCAMYYAIPSNNQRSIWRYYGFILPHGFIQAANIGSLWYYIYYPTLARVFQGFRVWGKFVFPTLEHTVTPTNLANQVKIGHALDQSRSVQKRRPERAHQNNEPSWRSSRNFRDSFETINWLYLLFRCGIKTKDPFWMASLTLIFIRSVELRTHSA